MRTTLGSLLLALPLAGCTLLDSGPSADDAAQDLAAALSAENLAEVRFTGVSDPQRWWDDATSGLGDVTPEVTVAEVSDEGEDTAGARLDYRWELDGGSWTYSTTARLAKVDDAWTVTAEPSLVAPDLRPEEKLGTSRNWAPRAEVLGARDKVIVTERPVVRIGLDKTKVKGVAAQKESARAIAALVDVQPAGLIEQVDATGDKAFVEAIVLREDDFDSDLERRLGEIPGGLALPDSLPLAPTREFARPILGSVGAVTAEIVEQSNGVYQPGDQGGVSGLQARYDEQLRGTVGLTVAAVDPKGRRRTLWESGPEPGTPLHLTLDVRLQERAEQLLAGVGPASALVALRASTGEVLAAASGPGGDGLSTSTVGQYAPGSTMKVVTSLALLRAGLSPSSRMGCPATTVVDGKSFKNYSDYPPSGLGAIDLRRALANSCNTAFIGERERVSQAELADSAASLGLGVDYDLGYPVFLGSVPAKAASETDHAASMIGQARVVASPVAMAGVAASVASGRTVLPTLVRDAPAVEAEPPTRLTPREAGLLRQLMRGVVTSGSGVFLADVPGPPVIAKTGTAEFGTQDPPATHAWMIAAQGDLAVAVFVDVGESGSRTAGPILEAFLRAAA